MIDISTFTGDSYVTYAFRGDVSGPQPYLVIELSEGKEHTVIALSPADLGEFASHVEDARKALLGLWMKRDQ